MGPEDLTLPIPMPRPPTPPPELNAALPASLPPPPRPTNPLVAALSMQSVSGNENLFNSAMEATNSQLSVKKATTFVTPEKMPAKSDKGAELHSDEDEVEPPPQDPQSR